MRVAYAIAGGGGTYCGACLRDCTTVRALRKLGCDVLAVPLYTPIRTDWPDETIPSLFQTVLRIPDTLTPMWSYWHPPRWRKITTFYNDKWDVHNNPVWGQMPAATRPASTQLSAQCSPFAHRITTRLTRALGPAG